MSPNSLSEAQIILRAKQTGTQEWDCRSISLMNKDAEFQMNTHELNPTAYQKHWGTWSNQTDARNARMVRHIQMSFHTIRHHQNEGQSHMVLSKDIAKAFHKTQYPWMSKNNSQQTGSRTCLSVIKARFDGHTANIIQNEIKATEFS